MQYKRILVLGNCGSGKTTFANQLSNLTELPVIHLDKLYWKPGWTESTKEEFYNILHEKLIKEKWIIDGNYKGTLPLRLQFCDQVIYFDFPRFVCLYGVLKRVIQNLGRTRPDMGDGCPDKLDWAFIRYVWKFEKSQGAENKKLVHSSRKPAVIFRTRRDSRRYLEGIKNNEAQHRENDDPTIGNG